MPLWSMDQWRYLEREVVTDPKSGGLQRERGYASLEDANEAYEQLLMGVIDGSLDPAQPVFREDLED
jgi:hypothetical protein